MLWSKDVGLEGVVLSLFTDFIVGM
jgi:hypothetical protein